MEGTTYETATRTPIQRAYERYATELKAENYISLGNRDLVNRHFASVWGYLPLVQDEKSQPASEKDVQRSMKMVCLLLSRLNRPKQG